MRAGKTITSPDGDRWRVRRQWADRSFPDPIDSIRKNFGDAVDGGGPGVLNVIDFGDSITVTLAIAAGMLIVCFVLLPLLGVALELIPAVAVVGFGVFGRVVLGRPWVIEAVDLDDRGRSRTFAVRGWRASGRAVDEISTAIAAGSPPPER
jgi:hypothetical protein